MTVRFSYFLVLFFSLANSLLCAQGLLWEISSPGNTGSPKSYLFGTIHTSNSRVFDFKTDVLGALNRSEVFSPEINPDSLKNPMKLMSKLIMKEDKTLSDFLSEREYEVTEKFFKDSLQMPLVMLQRIQPAFLAALVVERGLNDNSGKPALDFWLHEKAVDSGKKVIALETIDEQVKAFASVDYQTQADMLYEEIQSYRSGGKTGGMLEAYVAGDLDELYRLAGEYDMLGDDFENTFLINRNNNMAKRAAELMESGKSIFIAVGAAHLPGEFGLIALFREMGYHVTPVSGN